MHVSGFDINALVTHNSEQNADVLTSEDNKEQNIAHKYTM